MNRLEKLGFRITMSSEVLRGYDAMRYTINPDPRYGRIVESETIVEPTYAQWELYYRAKALWEELRDNPYFIEGGDDYPNEVREPQPERVVEYGETYDEWVDRCRAMEAEVISPVGNKGEL